MHHPRHHCFCLSSCPQRVLFTRQSQTAPAVHVVQNARPFYRTGRRSHITPNVALLHWLPFNSQIVFKITLTVITCKALYGFAPFYISALLTLKHQWLASINQKPLPLPLKHGMERFHDKVWLSWSWYFSSNWPWCFFFFSCIKILYCPISTTTVQTLRGRWLLSCGPNTQTLEQSPLWLIMLSTLAVLNNRKMKTVFRHR